MKAETSTHARDTLLRDTFTPAEWLLTGTLFVTCLVAFAVADPRSFWVLGFFLIAGGFSIVILKTHEHTHPFFIDLLWPKFWLLSAPAWILFVRYVAGLFRDPVRPLEIGGETFLTLREVNPWLPATAGGGTTWITLLGFASIYLIAVQLFIVPKSRAFFERVLPWLCLLAVALGICGYTQKIFGLEEALFTRGTGRADFFAWFPYDGHWAAFALLWSTVCVAQALLTLRYGKDTDFLRTIGPWYLSGAVLLGGSGLVVHARLPAAVLLLTFSVLLQVAAFSILANKSQPHRSGLAASLGLLSVGFFAGGVVRFFQAPGFGGHADSLRRAAADMFADNPLFGWGMDAFGRMLPFYADDTLLGARHERAASDALQFAAEFGIIGALALGALLVALLVRYFRGRHDINLTNHLLLGCAGCLVLALVDSPFMSPAVFFSFAIVFFTALRWADLSRNKVDEVDARPILVTPASERRVPFYTGEYEDIEK